MQEGEISRSWNALQTEYFAEKLTSQEVQNEFRRLLPQKPHQNQTAEDLTARPLNAVLVQTDQVKKMILSVKNGVTNCQTTALRPELLKCLFGSGLSY
jgi:hypothetical protein